MRGISSFGLCTCAAVYAAAGIFGLFLLINQPDPIPTGDGYGIARIAATGAH